jgi:CMP-2-keto-3-deoxyoctulosonic acid synthetase
MSTIVHRAEPEAAGDPNRVKVVVDGQGFALYFSRAPIPYPRKDTGLSRRSSTSVSTSTAANSCSSS